MKNKIIHRFNKNLYLKVLKARRSLGIEDLNCIEVDHPLIGKKAIFGNKKKYIIKRAYKMWIDGWFICLLLDEVGTTSWTPWIKENINCRDENILFIMRNDNENFKLEEINGN